MKIILSPAKKLNTDNITVKNGTQIQFLEEAKYLINELQNYSVAAIQQLMGLSDNLAQLNWQRIQDWEYPTESAKTALFMFQGDVYQGMRATSFTDTELDFAQQHMRILSGLYGLLKPLDLILPYRLEMGTKMKNKKGNNLYDFWGDKLHNAVSKQLDEDQQIINLASAEYSKVLKLSKLNNPVITPVFKDYKNGKLKVISFFAKKARGEMAHYIVKNRITNPDELKLFSNIGYNFAEENKEKKELLFVR